MTRTGYKVATVALYDAKNDEIATAIGLEEGQRWCGGRQDGSGNTIPDITLTTGEFFVPDNPSYEVGPDTITEADLPDPAS